MIIVRYADDIVVGFEREVDARRFLDMMRERFESFSLSLHPEKTRLIEFGRFAAVNRKRCGLGKPETFSFLASLLSAASLVGASSLCCVKPGRTVCGRS
jgi:RNA-directed DNA polymerase